jgi:ribosomal protein L17
MEKGMKTNAKIEQDLNEEQLQAITGACNQCLFDLEAAKGVQNTADSLITAAERETNDGNTKVAKRLLTLARGKTAQAQRLLDQVAARGHDLSPHANLPDLNK